ncbi:methionine--tRNA ligase, partial [Candidatus Poribacteria bacterium]|nr:methionine--tRNA ligase [Candidatus Poribacteria bacterium]
FDNGDIYKNTYDGYYCTSCEAFYEEDDLVNGSECPTHETECEWLSEENFFFSLSKYEKPLLDFHREHPEFVQPASRRNEVMAFIERGLRDFSISRTTIKWGIPTPVDEEHVIYVWFDALINYLTGVGFPADDAMYEKYWPADVHVIGKDIWRFHCIYWPAMLMSAGLPLPGKVCVHGFLTLRGEKMSKSRGIYVDPVQAVDQFGADAIRYFLVRDMPFGQDGDFSWASFVARYNADLANDLGNMLNRTLNLVKQHFDGRTPALGDLTDEDRALVEAAEAARDEYVSLMDDYAVHSGLDQALGLVRTANKYMADTQPWKVAKSGDKTRAGTILYCAMEAVRWAAVMVTPAIPTGAAGIHRQLGIADPDGQDFSTLSWGGLAADAPLGDVAPLFPRLEVTEEDDEEATASEADEAGGEPAAEAAVEDAFITFDDFMKVDLRTAEVLEAEAVPKADKLLKLTIQVGDERRTIVAGVAQHYTPEEMVGKRIAVVANLKPRKVFGIESQGMLLAGNAEDGSLVLAEFSKDIPSGSRVS